MKIEVGNTIKYDNEHGGECYLYFKVEAIKTVSKLNTEETKVFEQFKGDKTDFDEDTTVYIGTLTDEDENYEYEKSFDFVSMDEDFEDLFDMTVY